MEIHYYANSLPSFEPQCRRKLKCGGFTLIEVIGVLAILAIMATVIASTTTKHLDVAAANLESTNLVNFATALQNSVMRYRYIPGTTGTSNWVQMVAAELGLDTNSVTFNARRSRRIWLTDPNNIALPYRQTISGAGALPTVRMMILSTLGPAFPTTLTDGPMADFNTLWNALDGTRPSVSVLSGWSGTGDDLKIQRINLSPLFVQLKLFNYPPPPMLAGRGSYSIDRSASSQVPDAGIEAFFLKSTILGLLDYTNTLQAEQILTRDCSFVYMLQVWRGSLDFGQTASSSGASQAASALGAAAAMFLSSPYNNQAAAGTTPPVVFNAITNYMSAYMAWANAGFPNSGVIYNQASAAQTAMSTDMANLINNLTTGGCTNPPVQ